MKDETGISRRSSESQSLLLTRCFTHSDFPHAKGKGLQAISLLRFKIPALHDTLENLKPYFTFSCSESRKGLMRDLIEKINLKPSQLSHTLQDVVV